MAKEVVRFKESLMKAAPVSQDHKEGFKEAFKEEKGIFISTYGCQMNDNDSERMMSLMEQMNYTPVTTPEQASVIIINSCSVREKPVHKVHSEVGRYRKLKDANKNLKIGVAGCVAQQEKDKLLKDLPLLDFVIGPDNIDSLPAVIANLQNINGDEQRLNAAKFKHQEPYNVETLVRNPGVSTFVNITKGCDNFCTFCVVPYTRGRERSRSYKDLVSDINKLTTRGVKEVTLLGQNVNSYKCETGVNFANLLKGLCKDTDIQRLRYQTSHPKDFSDELIEISAENKDKICEYIHLPVQSGNSEVLQRMNRGYTREDYLKIIEKIHKNIPNVALSTDIIVGFPGETEEQFEDTMTLLDEVPYEILFAFKYSPRPFTKAAKFEGHLPEEVQKERLERLFQKHKTIAFELCKRYEGKTVKVLVETQNADTKAYRGRNEQNKAVHFLPENPDVNLIGKTVDVKVLKAFPTTLRGELATDESVRGVTV